MIKRLAHKDEEALLALQNSYENYCYRIAYSFLRQEEAATECVNEAFMALWQCEQKPANLKAYLAKVTRNAALQHLRRNNAQKRSATMVLLDELAECLPDTNSADAFEGRLLRGVLTEFVRGLSAHERYVFLRRYWYGLAIEEIAQELSWHTGKVKSLLFRLRKKLKKSLEKEGYII